MNIYISNLNFATKDESLRNLFAGYGDVSSANIITDRETGRSRGFGFVEMPDETQGQSAIDALNETEFEGKVITVNVAVRKRSGTTGADSATTEAPAEDGIDPSGPPDFRAVCLSSKDIPLLVLFLPGKRGGARQIRALPVRGR